MSLWILILVLAGTAVVFAGVGLGYTLFFAGSLDTDEYIAARGQISTLPAIATLFASAMGPWILFGPPEAATWGGLPAVIGYSLGAALPVLGYVPLGLRLRRILPEGYSIAEYVRHRYGKKMHVLVLGIILFFLFISLAAQITGIAFLVQLIAEVPLWATAALVLVATLAYTLRGGLKASIVTDGLQAALILPLLAAVTAVAVVGLGGLQEPVHELEARAPQLLGWSYRPGIEGGLALVIGIGSASLFNQGTWQRVYAIDSASTLRKSFLATALINAVVVALMGGFGLAAVGLEAADPASTALFNLLLDTTPAWMSAVLLVLGLALVMSSADTIMSAVASIVIADIRLLCPESLEIGRRRSGWIVTVFCLPVFYLAAQGYSVLYLFLVADLVCAAALVPVFAGLFNPHVDQSTALWSTAAGLTAGGLLFPAPGSDASLLPAFAAALLVPAVVGSITHLWKNRSALPSKTPAD